MINKCGQVCSPFLGAARGSGGALKLKRKEPNYEGVLHSALIGSSLGQLNHHY